MLRVRMREGVAPADASACFGLQVVLLVVRRSAGSAERETLLGSGICSRAAKQLVGTNRAWAQAVYQWLAGHKCTDFLT